MLAVYNSYWKSIVSQDGQFAHLFVLLGSEHELGADVFVELLRAKSLKLHSTLLEGKVLLVSVLGNLGSHVVTNDRVQAGDEHQTIKPVRICLQM